MIARVLERVLLPFSATWVTSPTVERVFQSEVEGGVTGAESRGAMRQVPQVGVSWSILPTTTEQRSRLDEILRSALREGEAATPFWGRGLKVASGSTGTTLELAAAVPDGWVPVAGAVLWIPRQSDGPFAEEYELATVASVTGHTLTLEDELSADVPEGSLVWPVIAGRFTGGEYEAVHGAVGVFKFAVRANDTTAMPYARAVGPDPSDLDIPDPYEPPPTVWPEVPILARVRLLDANALSLLYQVEVDSNASDVEQAAAVWQWADYAAGLDGATWATETSAVRETSDTTLWRVGMRYRQAYYLRCTITEDGIARTSVPIVIPGLYPEAMMRVLQERRADTGGAAFTWPYSAPAYPADGFFDSAIASLGNTAHATILSALRTALRTAGFMSNFLNPWSGSTIGGTFGRYVPLANAFDSTWTLTPGSGFTPAAYQGRFSESVLSTAITTSNWSLWWDDIARLCLWAYKRFYRLGAIQSAGEEANSKSGSASQASGDMKPLILTAGGLAEQAQDAFDASTSATGTILGARTTINPASIDTFPWGQIYNAPGNVRMEFIDGHWIDVLQIEAEEPGDPPVILPGEKSLYRAAYYNGYGLESIGVVGQAGVTPYHDNAGLTDVFYTYNGLPTNLPPQSASAPTLSAHTPFVHQGTIPHDDLYEIEVGSGLDIAAVNFLWLDVFNTTSRPLRNLGVEMVCYCVWYRSPIPEDEHWTHYIHQSSTP
jgi:hypothetical protein